MREGEEDGIFGDDLDSVGDENEVDLSLTGEYIGEFDTLEDDD